MEKILREVQRSTIDYEEYYSQIVLSEYYYGQNYGAYGSTFYDLGGGGPLSELTALVTAGGDGIDGTDCSGTMPYDEYFFTEDCEGLDSSTYDTNMGLHPTAGDELSENALCETVDCDGVENALQTELYLIDSSASRKVIFALESFTNDIGDDEQVISMLALTGDDVDGDGITDYWECSEEYTCENDSVNHWYYYSDPDVLTSQSYNIPEGSMDLTSGGIDDDDFEPITPSGMNVVELYFYIAPFEDPYRAFSETDQSVQQHPHVIVYMTVEPSSELTQGLLGEDWTLTLQGSASAAVFSDVPSEYQGWWRWE